MMKSYEQITHFAVAYLHEDWDIDYDSIEDAFLQYREDSDPTDVVQFSEELSGLLTQHRSEEELILALQYNGWFIEVEDNSQREFLLELLRFAKLGTFNSNG